MILMSNPGKYLIVNDDSFAWLKTRKPKTIHAVVTDPPYSVVEYSPKQLEKRDNGNGGIWRLPQSYDGCTRSPIPRFTVLSRKDLELIADFHGKLAPSLMRVLVPGGHVLIASQVLLSHIVIREFCEAGFELRGQIVRVVRTLRGGDRPKGAHDRYPEISVSPRACWEPWIVFRKQCEGCVRDNLAKWSVGGLRRPSENMPFHDIIISCCARGQERHIAPHPSLKPQAFLRQIVRAVLPLGKGVILDPFMGSGSTIAAASCLGMKSIGVEVNAKYFSLAEKAIPHLARLRANGTANGSLPVLDRES